VKHEKPPAIVASAEHETHLGTLTGAVSFRPLGYSQSLLVGFVVGCLAFLVTGRATAELPTLLAFAAGGATLAIAANFIAERRVRAKLERQRGDLARYMFGPGAR